MSFLFSQPVTIRSVFAMGCALSLTMSLGFIGCDETLPLYRDPRDVFKGEIRGRYALSRTENSVRIDLFVINTFDETLEAKGILEGTGTITAKRDVRFRRTFKLTPANWARGKFNPSTGKLTMNPNDTLVLIYTWDYRDDAGRDLREDLFRYAPDPSCSLRRISEEEFFALRFRLKVFDKVADVEAIAGEYGLCHVTAWIDPKVCTSIRTDLPCREW